MGTLPGVWLLLFLAGGDAPGVREPRHVLALYDGLRRNFYREDIVHELLETPLNYLGMVVDRHDIRTGPPREELVADARAVITFFADVREAAPDWLCAWLEDAVSRRQLRVVHVGDLEILHRPHGPEQDPSWLVAWLARFGLDYDERFVPGPIGIQVAFRDPKLCAFEADPRAYAVHFGPRSTSERNRVWVTTTTPVLPGDRRTPVVTGPWGGLALDPFFLRKGTESEDRRWHVDPITFFREALGLGGVPTPQPAMLNGRRLFFLHVDGDGFESISTVRPGLSCGQVLCDDVLKRYELPFTASVIVRSVTDDYLAPGDTPLMRTAREILNLPNVEAGSHGVLHPLDWQRSPSAQVPMAEVTAYPELKHYQYSPLAEVRDSVRFLTEHLLAPGKPCTLMQWTGMANPSAEVVAECDHLGILNLNGGEFRFDALIHSMGYVTPWARTLGSALQVYVPAGNENNFPGFFDTMPTAFAHIDATLRNTGGARVLKPAGIYIHYYIAERPARLATLHDLIRRWAFEEETAPAFASFYVRAVRSALSFADVYRTPSGFALRRFGGCRTARLDGEQREIDWSRTQGLIGARRIGDALYLHLAGDDADVVLADSAVQRPHVVSANLELADVALDAASIRVVAAAFGRREIVFGGFAPHARVRRTIDGETRVDAADADGRVLVSLPRPGRSVIELRVP